MKAVYYENFGDVGVLQIGERPIPKPAAGQVLVKVAAAGVNPMDRRLRRGEYQEFFQRTFPIIPGWDVAGRIVELGPDVTGWQVGDDIVGLGFTWKLGVGSYAEYMTIDDTAIARKPARMSFEQAATLPLVSLTAWQSLVESGKLQRGQSVFIQSGAGGIGSVAISVGRYVGARVYTTARAKNHDYVKERGATVAIDYKTSNYVHVLKDHEPDGVDVVLETLEDKIYNENAVRIVKSGGTIIYMNNEPPQMSDIAERKIHAEFLHHRADGKMLSDLMQLFDKGELMMPRLTVMALDDAAEAHRQSESWRVNGKIALKVQDL
jgi:NADPH:quinone reductase-like Zn-dependent oxidoreductase